MPIRPAAQGEHSQITSIAQRAKMHWGYPQHYLQAWREELTYSAEDLLNPRYDFWCLQIDQAVVGFYALTPHKDQMLELEALFVEPERIGSGCGRLLMQHAMDNAAERTAVGLHIVSDPHALGFYQAMGAVQVGVERSAVIAERTLPIVHIRF